jgi:uncharacterized protein (DUF58 family)
MSQFDLERLSRFHRMAAVIRKTAKPLRSELRGYAPGDDYRTIDWPICARRDELLTRTRHAQAERHFYVLLSCSRGMFLGDPPKIGPSLEAAAMLSLAALQNESCLRLTAFSDRTDSESPLLRGMERFPLALNFLNCCSRQESPSNVARAAREFSNRRQPPGPVVLIGDFFDLAGLQSAMNILADRGYSPRLAQIHAPCDADPRFLGDVELFDVETGNAIEAVVTQKDLKRYRAAFARFLASVRDDCSRRNIPLVQTASNAPEHEFLESVLKRLWT